MIDETRINRLLPKRYGEKILPIGQIINSTMSNSSQMRKGKTKMENKVTNNNKTCEEEIVENGQMLHRKTLPRWREKAIAINKLMLCLLVVFSAINLSAQTTYTASSGTNGAANLAPGSPTGSYATSGFESVNPYSGKINFVLPLLNVGGRGSAGYTINLKLQRNWSVDHKIYDPNLYSEGIERYLVQHMYIPKDAADYGDVDLLIGPGLMKGILTGSNFNGANTICGTEPCFDATLTKLTFEQSDGTEIPFRDVLTGGKIATSFDASYRKLRGRHFVSTDGTNATFISDADVYDRRIKDIGSNTMFFVSGTLYLANGTEYKIQNGQVTEITDVNGNKSTPTKDSLGREIAYTLSENYLEKKMVFKGTNGVDRTIKVNYASLGDHLAAGQQLQSNYDLFTVADPDGANPPGYIYNPPVVANVELPDGRKYEFKYNSYGELAEVKLPTGGRIEYVWQTGQGLYLTESDPNKGNTYQIYRRVEKRRVYENNVLQSETVYGMPDLQTNFVTVENYRNENGNLILENKTKHYYPRSPQPTFYPSYPTDEADQFDGRETKTEVYDANNNLLRKTENTWQAGTPLAGNETIPINVRLAETSETLADANLVSKKTFSYDQFNNVTDTYEYDFGNGAPGAFLRRSHSDYVTNPNYVDYTGAHLRGLPSQMWVSSDEAGNNKVSFSQMEYDNYASDANHAPLIDRANVSGFDAANFGTGNPWRGNVTAMTSFANAAAQTDPITAFSQYDILGNVVKMIDAKGNASTISYDDNFGAPDAEARTNSAPAQLNGQSTFAFATSTTNALGWVTGYSQVDYFTGASVDLEDINGVVSSNFYNDPLDRPTQSIIANSLANHKQQTTITYDDANRKITATSDLFAFGDNLSKSESFYDGLGRTTENRKYEDDGGYIATMTEYDALSRVKRVTNPYRPLQSEPQLWTTSTYDALGRVISVTAPDNSVVQTAYSGNAVTVTDQAGKQRRSLTNALGQLARVDEPDDSGNLGTVDAPTQATSYLYDTLGKMVKVTQGVQSRFFKYDSLGRLLRVRQPEQETNASLALADSISGNNDWSAGFTYDANGNLLTATDTKGTVITSTYDNLNRVLSRSYSDSTPQVTYTYDDPNIQFSKGKLTKTSNAVSSSEILSMDNLGRVLSSRQTTDGVNYDSSYTYNLSGALLEETYPSGRKVKNTFQTDGDLSKIETMQTGGSYQARADNFSYAAHGAIKHLQIGNGLWESASFNNRLQVTQLGLGTSATDTSQWKLDYDFGTTDNNGNIKSQTVTSPVGTYAQSFTYDSLDRLKTANETSGGNQTWTQAFTYDRYGNRIGFSQDIGGQVNNSTPSIDQNTNRFNLGQGYTYDAAGNVITDNQGRQFTFNGDNKQTEVKDASNNVVGTYSYDGDGKRIKKVTSAETTTFVYSGGKLVAEYQLTTATPTTATTQYLGTDMLGSPRVVSDQTGAVVSRRDFMPFGEDLTRANYGSDTIRQKFTGYEKDTETSLDFAEARYYNSNIGRFTAVDPLLASGKSADPQTFNRYIYTMNNPLVMTDPTGMLPGCPPDCDENEDKTTSIIDVDGTIIPPSGRLQGYSDGTFPGDRATAGLRNEGNISRSTPTIIGAGGAAYNYFIAAPTNLINGILNRATLGYIVKGIPENRLGYAPYYQPSSQQEAEVAEATTNGITAASLLFGGIGSSVPRPSFAGFSTRAVSTAESTILLERSQLEFTNRVTGGGLRGVAENYGLAEPVKFVSIEGKNYILDGNHRTALTYILKRDTVLSQPVTIPFGQFRTQADVINSAVPRSQILNSSAVKYFGRSK